jgi:hypothetical protein
VDKPNHRPVQEPSPPPADLPFSERLLAAIAAGTIETGTLVHLPTSPIAFLKEVPLPHGGLVDKFSLQLAEYGARLPPASDERPGQKADGQHGRTRADKRKSGQSRLWLKISKEFAGFRQQPDGEHPRVLDLQDYRAWPDRKTPGDVSISDGVMVENLLEWVRGELLRLVNDLHQSGAADAASKAAISALPELREAINIGLSKQANAWCNELNAIKAEAKKVKRRYTAGYAAGKPAPISVLVDQLALLVRRVQVLYTSCYTIYLLAPLPNRGGPKDLGRFFKREAGSSVPATADDVEFGLMLLARIHGAALWKWAAYLLPLTSAAAQAMANELLSMVAEGSEWLNWIQVGFTFDELLDDLRQELGCRIEISRVLSEIKRLSKMSESEIKRLSEMDRKMFDQLFGETWVREQ